MEKYRAAFIILFSLGILVISACAAPAGEDISFVPPPEGGDLTDSKSFQLAGRQIQAVLYNTATDSRAVADYYRQFFHEQGFAKLIDKFEKGIGGLQLRFKKDDFVVNVSVMAKADKTEVVIAKYFEPAGAAAIEKSPLSLKDVLFDPPKQDIPGGADTSVVPRPPDSVCFMNMRMAGERHIMYRAALSASVGADFYRKVMAGKGWDAGEEIAVKDAVEAYKQAENKNNLGINLPFIGAGNIERIIGESIMLEFFTERGNARIVVSPDFIRPEDMSIVSIIYKEE